MVQIDLPDLQFYGTPALFPPIPLYFHTPDGVECCAWGTTLFVEGWDGSALTHPLSQLYQDGNGIIPSQCNISVDGVSDLVVWC